MKTKLHSYYFDCADLEQNKSYRELTETLRATKGCGKRMKSHGGGSHYSASWLNGVEIEIDPSCLFDNQWNTSAESANAPNMRVFDWAEDALFDRMGRENKTIKRGHYLEITDEMREIRRNTHKCRYCGKQEPAAKDNVFCPHCRGSEHLKEKDLHLTRMKAIDDESECAPLSDAERDHLIPLWQEDQITGNSARGKARMAKARKQVQKRHDEAVTKAANEFIVASWCLDHGFLPEIAIYYPHTGKITFGWNKPLDADQVAKLLECVSEFPYAYEIKCADGKTLG